MKLPALNGKLSRKLRILRSNDPLTCNTFENPYAVILQEMDIDVGEGFSLVMPAESAAVLTVKLEAKHDRKNLEAKGLSVEKKTPRTEDERARGH